MVTSTYIYWLGLNKENKMIYKKQCNLKKGNVILTTWVDESLAVKGKHLEIDNNGIKEQGWFVHKVFDKRVSEKYLKERERDYLRTRKASDI